jgi:hypothetical protein
MAGFTGVKVEFPEMHELRKKLRQFPSNLAAKHLGAALRKASKPGLTALRSEVRANQKGPTGNLRRAIATKVKTYKKRGSLSLERSLDTQRNLLLLALSGLAPSKSSL